MLHLKSFFWLATLCFFAHLSFGQSIVIDENLDLPKKADNIFTNNSQNNLNLRTFSVIRVNKDCVILKLENSDGTCGDETQIQIERGLKLSNHSFRLWATPKTDHVTSKQFIEHSTLVLNKDPFEHGVSGLRGYIELKVRVETSYKYQLPKTKDYDYFTYAMNFKYD